jgi:diguanylate cyclase (GGDEF)-like protein
VLDVKRTVDAGPRSVVVSNWTGLLADGTLIQRFKAHDALRNSFMEIKALTDATLADTTPSSTQRRAALAVSICLALAALFMGFIGKTPGPQLPSFAAAFYPALAGIYLLIALLIDSEAKWHRSIALVVLSSAFFFAFAAVNAYLLVFPGALTAHGLFGALPHSSFWVWMFWHIGVTALMGLYAVTTTREGKASATAVGLSRIVLPLLVLAAVSVLVRLACSELLPPIRGDAPYYSYTLAFNVLRFVLIFGDLAAVVCVVVVTGCRSVLNLWLAVVLWGQLLEVLLGFGGQARYSYGWYFSRLHGGVSALIILIVFLRSMLKMRDAVLRLNLELQHQVLEDPLTGLANQRDFFDELHRAVARHNRKPTSLTLLVLDVDHFKLYNDTYGHAEGNVCLRTIANLLQNSASRPDDLVARIGGEEFALLLPDTEIEGARALAMNIIRKLAEAQLEHKASLFRQVTISIGGAVCDETCRPPEKAFFEAADKALYTAKSDGRNRLEIVKFESGASLQD